jgi:hypothetical protein
MTHLIPCLSFPCHAFHFKESKAATVVETYNGGWKIDVGLDKGNNLGATSGSRDHQDIFGISQNCVVEEDAKEHERQWSQLLSLFLGRNKVRELLYSKYR